MSYSKREIADRFGYIKLLEGKLRADHNYFVGVAAIAGKKNANNRIYSKNILKRAIRDLQPRLAANQVVGRLDHPGQNASPERTLSEAAFIVKQLNWLDDQVIARCMILDNPHGAVVRSLLESGVPCGLSTRSLGNLEKRSDGSYDVKALEIITIDLVAEPSNLEMVELCESILTNSGTIENNDSWSEILNGLLKDTQTNILEEWGER